jgi:hypothetical protein
LTPVRLPDQVSTEVLKIYQNMYNSMNNSPAD